MDKNFKVTPLFNYPYCCLCFEQISGDTCYVDKNGVKWDLCKSCGQKEEELRKVD